MKAFCSTFKANLIYHSRDIPRSPQYQKIQLSFKTGLKVLRGVGSLLHLYVVGINQFGTAIKTILSQLFLSVPVITPCLFQFQKLDYLGPLVSALHTRTATMFPPPTIPTKLFNFILNNRRHDQIHHHLSSPLSAELMNKKIIRTWQEKLLIPYQAKWHTSPRFLCCTLDKLVLQKQLPKYFKSTPIHHITDSFVSLCFWSWSLFACLYFTLHFSKIKSYLT